MSKQSEKLLNVENETNKKQHITTMPRTRLLVLLAYLLADISISSIAPLFFSSTSQDIQVPASKDDLSSENSTLVHIPSLTERLNPLRYNYSTSIIDLLACFLIRVSLLLGAFILYKLKVFNAEGKCQTAIVFMNVLLYAFATGKLLAIAEEDQQIAMWLLVCWNLVASILHPIVWNVTIKAPIKTKLRNDEQLEKDSLWENMPDGEDSRLSALWISKILFKYAFMHWFLLAGAIVSLFIYAITKVFIPDYIGRFISVVSTSDDMSQVTKTVIILASLAFTSSIFGGFRGYFFTDITGKMSRDIRRDLFNSLVKQEIAFYDKTNTGDLISRLSSDTATVLDSLTTNMNICTRSGIMIVGSLLVMLGISWRLTIICFVTTPAYILINKYFGKYFDRIAESIQSALAETNKKAEEVLAQIRTVRSFANEETEAIHYDHTLEKVVYFYNRKANLYMFQVWCTEACQHLSLIVVLLYGGYLVVGKEVTAGQLVTFFLYQMNVTEYLHNFGNCYTGAMAAIGSSRTIMRLMHRKPVFSQGDGKLKPVVEGNILLDGLHFTYPSRKNNPVLNDLTLEVKRGETVAFVGPSGGGKSSIVSLIERFYLPLGGNIYMDGTPINQFDHRYYHRNVCLVSQEPQLFSGSIKENIAYGLEECSEERIFEAAKTANAYDFIMKLEKKFDTECGERGVQLSGGQKQRIAIARAVVRDPKVLILDEATSALDTDSEAIVQEALNRCAKDRTVVIIAHRLSTIKNAQKIAVIEKGRIIQIGNHETLMADPKGLYYSLVVKQLASTDH